MATKNEDLIAETAAALLTAIKESAKEDGGASYLRDLAEAFALTASTDPNVVRAPRRIA